MKSLASQSLKEMSVFSIFDDNIKSLVNVGTFMADPMNHTLILIFSHFIHLALFTVIWLQYSWFYYIYFVGSIYSYKSKSSEVLSQDTPFPT